MYDLRCLMYDFNRIIMMNETKVLLCFLLYTFFQLSCNEEEKVYKNDFEFYSAKYVNAKFEYDSSRNLKI